MLLGVHLEVAAAGGVESGVSAALDDASCFDDQDLIGAANGGEAMRDYEGGAAFEELGESLLN